MGARVAYDEEILTKDMAIGQKSVIEADIRLESAI